MATSGSKSITVTSWDTLKFSWERTSYSIANNTSTIKWTLQLISTSSGAINSTASKDWAVTIDGTKYSGTNTIGISNNSTKTLASGTTTIKHNNDGSKTFSYSFSQEFAITFSGSSIGTKSGSGTGTLNSIPRQATLTAAPDFNDEENPTITYSNPAGNAVTALDACISFTGSADNIAYKAVSKTGSSYTFNLTEDERKTLRQWVTAGNSSREVIFYIRTTISGTRYFSTIKKNLTIINDTPTLSSTVDITDDLTKELTGNSDTIIRDVSTVNYAINAQAYKEAAINGYWVQNSNNYYYDATSTIKNLQSGYFLFAASDNRGRHIRKEITKSFIDYVKLTCNADISIALTGEQLATITLKISGNYFNNTFGAVANTLTLAYRYKTEDGEYSDWVALTDPTLNSNTYGLTVTIENLDYRNAYTIQCRASDKIAVIETPERTIKAIPVFDWGKDDFNFNVPISIQGQPVADFIIEEGTISSWNYRKWERGIIECWTTRNLNTAVATAYGNGFYNGTTLSVNFPSGAFLAKPYVFMSVEPSNAQIYDINIGALSKNDLAYYISSMKSQTNASLQVNIYAYGFWK